MSDLHLEFTNYDYFHLHTPADTDREEVMVLAGDIGVGVGAMPFIEYMCSHFKYVIMVFGNHEFYGNNYGSLIERWKQYELNEAPRNFHFLYNDWRLLDGVRFLGGTMWTSFGDRNVMTMNAARDMMNDYRKIRNNGPLLPSFILEENTKFMAFLKEEFEKDFDGKTVVVTHHSPGNELRRRGVIGDILGGCYFADIEQYIGESDKASVWIHGHTHESWDYYINNTNVVCNPYGYVGYEINGKFDSSRFVIV